MFTPIDSKTICEYDFSLRPSKFSVIDVAKPAPPTNLSSLLPLLTVLTAPPIEFLTEEIAF